MHRLEKKLESLWKGGMGRQPDIAVILKAGRIDLFVYSLLFSLSLERTSSLGQAQPAAQRHRVRSWGNLGVQMKGFLLQEGEFPLPRTWGVMSEQGNISTRLKSRE